MSTLTALQRMSISAKHREDWYRALSKTSQDGLPLFEVLERMEREFGKTKHALTPLLRVLIFRLRGNGPSGGRSKDGRRTVGTELQDLVPSGEAGLIQAGLMAGNTPVGFQNAADLLATQGRLKGAVMAAMAKPVGYLAALVVLLIFFSLKLLPKFEEGRPRSIWPSEAQALGWVADNITWVAGGIILSFVGAVMFVTVIAPKWTGPRRDWVDLRVWPFTMLAALNGANLLTSLAGYIGAGTPFNDAINNIKESANPYMKAQCERLIRMTKEGMRAEMALTKLSIVQPRYHWIIAVYGLSGDATAAYKTIAREMVESTQQFITNLFDRVISNVLLLVVGVVLFWIYASMLGIADAGVKRTGAIAADGAIQIASAQLAPPTHMHFGQVENEAWLAARASGLVC